MLDDLLIQFFDSQARRETSVYLLLIGKKTLSILYAALVHRQLQWFQLYPTLQRADYQAAIARLRAQGALRETTGGLVLADAAAREAAAARLPLPANYQPALGVDEFEAKFSLAVQVLSEASHGSSRYRPVISDWAIQQAVRQWWRQVDAKAAVAQLTTVFASLPEATADAIAQRLVGHDYVGMAPPASLAAKLQRIDQIAQLVAAVAENQAPIWQTLWGGEKPLGTPSAYQVLALVNRGQRNAQIAARLHLKPSTVNEHLLTLAIEGATLPLASFYSAELQAALTRQVAQADYKQLLAAVPGSSFFQVRLFQILSLQGRWPDANA